MNDPKVTSHSSEMVQLENALVSSIEMLQELLRTADNDTADAIDAVLIEAQSAIQVARRSRTAGSAIPAESRPLPTIEIASVAIATTGHATLRESRILNAHGYSRGEYGWLINVSPSRDPVIPEIDRLSAGLAGAIQTARKRSCTYLLLDRDADQIDGVKTYDW